MQFSLTPDLLFNSRQARQNANLRTQLETAGQEVITGRRTDVVAATNGRVGDAFLLQQATSDIARQRETADLANVRLDSATGSVGQIRENIGTVSGSGRIAVAQGSPGDLNLLAQNASGNLAQTVTALSQRSGTRHLFSGTNTTAPPLAPAEDIQTAVNALIAGQATAAGAAAAVDTWFDTAGGGFETTIYQGSAEDGPRLHVSDTQSYDPLPKGDDPLFRQILKGYALIAGASNLTDPDERSALMSRGLDLLDGAIEGAIQLETRLGATQQSIERLDENYAREAGLLAAAENDLLGRDPFEAAAQLQALENQLQASYTVTGRLGSLSLANFLR